MPELPEVETMRRGILGIVGSQIGDMQPISRGKRPISIEPRPATFRRRVLGQKISGIERAGKRVVVRLESDEAIVFEPRMTGLVLLTAAADRGASAVAIRAFGQAKP